MQKINIIYCAALVACLAASAAPAGATPSVGDGAKPVKYQTFKMDKTKYVPFDDTTTVTVECPDPAAAKWLEAHFAEWYGKFAPKVKAAAASAVPPEGEEAYSAKVDAAGATIAANTLAGVRWAAYTLRQLVIAKRGTFKTEGWIIPTLAVTDRPHLAFRAVHLCWFPEVRPQQMERAIRLAALLKFNYAIIEPWGMYGSEKHPWWHWPNPTMTKAEVSRLVAIGRDLGITLIPQINVYGHATSSRGSSQKHTVLDIHPEYAPLFEPVGWNWCLSNPETQRVLRELIAEMHENFGNPPYFHLGGDEAGAQTCPECVKTPNDELVIRHFKGLAEFVKSRGARAMMWHDMLIARDNPVRKGFTANGQAYAEKILENLPKDVVICDWQYRDSVPADWPTMTYFKGKGFDVAGCPWTNEKAMMPMAKHLVKIGGFGVIQTTWHHLRGKDWQKMYMDGAHAAWGSPVSHGVSFQYSLRLVGLDMKLTDYLDTGHINNQIPPAWWSN